MFLEPSSIISQGLGHEHLPIYVKFIQRMNGKFKMSEKKPPKVLFSQIEDSLEERQESDRRKHSKDIPVEVKKERRVQSRRDTKK